MHSFSNAHCLAAGEVAEVASPHGSASGSGLRSTLRRLANASGRIEFIIFLIMDWQFVSGCLPPRPSTTQFPSTTDNQCFVRWGLPPHCWCALSGARRVKLPLDRRGWYGKRVSVGEGYPSTRAKRIASEGQKKPMAPKMLVFSTAFKQLATPVIERSSRVME